MVHRPCCLVASGKWMSNEFGTRFRDPAAAQEYFAEESASSTQIILVTTAERFERFVGPSTSRTYRHFNCKVLHNAEHDPADRAHLGWNPKLLQGIIVSNGFNSLKDQVLQVVNSASCAGAVLSLSCTSNRHRSVGFGFTMFHIY